jgi:hypothetical protein
MRHITTAAAAATLFLVLTACSSEADNPPAAASPKPGQSAATEQPTTSKTRDDTAALEESVRDYTAALFSGNATGYDLLSTRCQKQMTQTEWITMAKGAHQQYGAQKATGVHVDQLVSCAGSPSLDLV